MRPAQSNDVAPGRNKAILQLADSSTIVLDESDTGVVAQQGSTKILKLTNGQLAYKAAASHELRAASQLAYNVISTPRGGQYQVVLPDGSKVWLNAASSLRFPTAFAGKERSVTITGEAYFDIVPNKNMPFTVQVNDTKIEVLGTRFNVNSYSNEAMLRTTLLDGAVRVSQLSGKPGEGTRLIPGQQASIYNRSASIIVNPVDTEAVVAWKNGMFQFESSDIQTIMRQMERWYDVDVIYAGKAPEGHYSWTGGRDQSLLKVLRILEEGDLKFKIEGKNLTVL
jgi:ferric-dicitrate binding protein FerR (iron transport regulator)